MNPLFYQYLLRCIITHFDDIQPLSYGLTLLAVQVINTYLVKVSADSIDSCWFGIIVFLDAGQNRSNRGGDEGICTHFKLNEGFDLRTLEYLRKSGLLV